MTEQGILPGMAESVNPYKLPRQKTIPLKLGGKAKLKFHLVQDLGSLEAMAAHIDAAPTFAWDTETSGLKPEKGDRICGHCFAAEDPEEPGTFLGYYVPVRHTGAHNAEVVQLAPETVADVLRPVFEREDGGEVRTFHRKFDAKMGRADGLILKRPSSDVAIEAIIHNENERSFALKTLIEKYVHASGKEQTGEVWKWLRADAHALGMAIKNHSKAARARLGPAVFTTPTYMERYGYSRLPVKLAAHYGCLDAIYTLLLAHVYAHVRHRFPDLWRREHAVGLDLERMEWRGLPVNPAAIRDAHERLEAAVAHWRREVRRLAPPEAKIGEAWEAAPSDLRRLFYQVLKLQPLRTTDAGLPGTDRVSRQILRRQYRQHDKLFHAIDQLVGGVVDGRPRPGLIKLLSTYSANYLRFYSPKTGCIHPCYNQLEERDEGGAPVTGRLGSSDPNVQNVTGSTIHLYDCHCSKCLKASFREAEELTKLHGYPVAAAKTEVEVRRRIAAGEPLESSISIRRYFVVPKGYVRVFIDFSQIELRILAWFSQDPELLRAYREGLDVHQMVADALGIRRKVAKQVNFGNSYGMTKVGLALRMPGYYDDPEGTEAEAERVLRAYFARYAGILDFRRSFARQMRMDGAQFTNPFGRPRRIPLLFAAEKWQRNRAERMMMSSIISGTSADLMKEASLRAGPIARRFGGEYVQTIHDELVFDLPLKTGWTNCVQALKASMEHWPFFTETTVYRGRRHAPVPILANVELSQTTWEDKREVIFADGGVRWAT
jgi:DNA polymerase-1